LREFCDADPAYFEPALPPFSLNGEPGADEELPGKFDGLKLWHEAFGCPVMAGPRTVLDVVVVGV